MLYAYRKTGEPLILQGQTFGRIVTRNGTAEITLTGSPITLTEGNEFRIEVALCDAGGAFITCLVAERSESRELMKFMAQKTGQEFFVNGIAIFSKSIDATKRMAIVRITANKPIVLKSNSKLHIMLERIERTNDGSQAIIGIMDER